MIEKHSLKNVIFIQTYLYVYIYTHIHTYANTHTHTHIVYITEYNTHIIIHTYLTESEVLQGCFKSHSINHKKKL